MNSARFDVLIVGGGFSGTILAIQLLYRAPALKIALMDKGSLPGRGAYGANYKCHLLNLPADMMSAFSEEPEHFLGWARANYQPFASSAQFSAASRLRTVYGIAAAACHRSCARRRLCVG